ncbi:MAG TPA: NnrS family protein, partial [Gammaproteobacteria bacterium]|nr:NnrS family protein [Gammaproteobacteria bacterium]
AGRSIKVGKVMTMAFLLIGFSFVIRVFFPLLFNSYELLIWLSGALWVSAYGLFIICYAPILFSSRIDGANG